MGNCGPGANRVAATRAVCSALAPPIRAPTIDQKVTGAGDHAKDRHAGLLVSDAPQPEIEFDPEEQMLKITSHAYESSAGVMLERWLTLLMGGDAVVGQDRISAAEGRHHR